MTRRFMQVLLFAVFATLLGAASAPAAGTFQYQVSLDDGAYEAVPQGSLGVYGLNNAQTTRVVVKPAIGPARLDTTQASAHTSYVNDTILAMAPGDVISVYQPSGAVAPTESFTIPPYGVSVVPGATTVNGTVPDGFRGIVSGAYRIAMNPQPFGLKPGAFAFPVPKVLPGEIYYLSLYNEAGDSLTCLVHATGETPLIEVSGAEGISPPPGYPGTFTDYGFSVDGLIASVAPSVRIVVRRNGTPYVDSSAINQGINVNTTTKPLPGDVIEIYRPQAAGAPSFTTTVPAVSGRFDPSVDLVAVDGPAAGLLSVRVCRQFDCIHDVRRNAHSTSAGRTLLNFAVAQGSDPAVDLRNGDSVILQYNNPDFVLQYELNLQQGDLVAPTQSLSIGSKLKLATLIKAFKKGFKVKLKSNEAGTAKLKLTIGKTTVASGTAKTKAGTTTVKLKFTKKGKKGLKKFKSEGRAFKSSKAKLTSVVTDASGNASTKSKSVTIKR